MAGRASDVAFRAYCESHTHTCSWFRKKPDEPANPLSPHPATLWSIFSANFPNPQRKRGTFPC